ncbi:MAG: preprotein translocase subunit SecA [Chthoniobacteraceae bacterium]
MNSWLPQPRTAKLLPALNRYLALYRAESDTRLAEIATALRAEAHKPAPDFHLRALSLIADAIRRTHALEAYPCQLLAGLHLAEGRLSEMATGEGKTLVALLPAFVFALSGKGAHVATVNAYLAERDAAFARPCFDRLGLTVGLLRDRDQPAHKHRAYAADVTYGVGTEFGFDYLRDQLALRAAGRTEPRFHEILLRREPARPRFIQRGHAFAVVDEADSVLIDEARSPLIISTGAKQPNATPDVYHHAADIAAQLEPGTHFTREQRCRLTTEGHHRAHELLAGEILAQLRRLWTDYVENALHALHGLRLDVHYIVRDDEVVIVDEFTGRLCPDRTWRGGLHQAVEAQAGAAITEESASEATITRPAYFRLYAKVCGMTGTAKEAATEIRASYGLETVIVPPNRPCIRALHPDRVFRTRAAKLAAVASDVAARYAKGQPVLIGSRTIENSEAIAAVLTVPFVLLNGKQDADEAAIIAGAGRPGTVTIATNMAGRGAHIPVPAESQRAGGLHVIGLERHDSARIDRQLIGRCARQGEPGSAQFFVSLDDDLIAAHAPDFAKGLAQHAADELPGTLASHFLRVQRRVERTDREARRRLKQFDEWLNELKGAL